MTGGGWASVVNTGLLVILTVVAGRNQQIARQAKDTAVDVAATTEATSKRLEDGLPTKVSDEIVERLTAQGYVLADQIVDRLTARLIVVPERRRKPRDE